MPRIFLSSGVTWTVPSDWTSNNTIEALGPGGDGGGQGLPGDSHGFAGGGGGAYAVISNLALTPGSIVNIQVPAGGSQLPTFLQDNSNVIVLSAEPGLSGSQFALGTGGVDAACIPALGAFSGGNGGFSLNFSAGAGGGGSAGPSGAGKGGGKPFSGPSGAGGGGSNGGASSVGANGTFPGSGGSGGAGSGGSGGGAGATPALDAVPGSAGGGGGGGYAILLVSNCHGAAGGIDAAWDLTHGVGGGGGGGGNDSDTANIFGGAGGLYGGGGGGSGENVGGGGVSVGGAGGQGLIVVTYTAKAVSGGRFPWFSPGGFPGAGLLFLLQRRKRGL